MNIRRMADNYRRQLTNTGKEARNRLAWFVSEPSHLRVHLSVAQECSYLRGWYVKLRKTLGTKRDLTNLLRAWQALTAAKDEEDDGRKKSLAQEAAAELDVFLQKLPRLIERSLTRAVRESGIRLR